MNIFFHDHQGASGDNLARGLLCETQSASRLRLSWTTQTFLTVGQHTLYDNSMVVFPSLKQISKTTCKILECHSQRFKVLSQQACCWFIQKQHSRKKQYDPVVIKS